MEIDFHRYPQPRTRHHTNPQFYLPLDQLHVVPMNYPPLVESVDWSEHYANAQAPQAVDIGCGWGNFLLNYAERHPEINVLGIETRMQTTAWLNEVIRGEKLPNVSALWYSVANGLQFLEANSVQSVFYFFPDPWFKKRHFKRRAFTTGLLDQIVRVLQPGGRLYLMTDVPEVDVYQHEVLLEHGSWAVQSIENDDEWLGVQTDHELLSQRLNIPYVRRICTRTVQA